MLKNIEEEVVNMPEEKLNEEIRRKTRIIESYEDAMQNLVKSTV